jgi:hypothetical protein
MFSETLACFSAARAAENCRNMLFCSSLLAAAAALPCLRWIARLEAHILFTTCLARKRWLTLQSTSTASGSDAWRRDCPRPAVRVLIRLFVTSRMVGHAMPFPSRGFRMEEGLPSSRRSRVDTSRRSFRSVEHVAHFHPSILQG